MERIIFAGVVVGGDGAGVVIAFRSGTGRIWLDWDGIGWDFVRGVYSRDDGRFYL